MVKPVSCLHVAKLHYISMVSKLYCTLITMTRDSISGSCTSLAARKELHHNRMLWLSIETIYTCINKQYMLYRLIMARIPTAKAKGCTLLRPTSLHFRHNTIQLLNLNLASALYCSCLQPSGMR